MRPFLAMRDAAARAGFDLVPVSSFRDFERQRAIWNAKFRGERPALDRRRPARDMAALEPRRARRDDPALVGAARREPAPLGQRRRRRRRPCHGGGLRAAARCRRNTGAAARLRALSAWLGDNMRRFGFYRPYTRRGRGVQPEPWHLSYAPVAKPALARMTLALLAEAIAGGASKARRRSSRGCPRSASATCSTWMRRRACARATPGSGRADHGARRAEDFL